MADSIKSLFRLYKAYGKMDMVWFLRDTKQCILFVFSDCIASLASLTSVFLLAERFGGFGGMDKNAVLFMLSYGTFAKGLYHLIFLNNNIRDISRVISRGQLDHNLIQPVSLPLQLLTEGFAPFTGSSVLIIGTALTFHSLALNNIPVTFVWVLKLIFCGALSTAVMMSSVLIVSSIAFYSPAAAEEIAPEVNEAFNLLKSYPLGGFSALTQITFTVFLPVGMAAWLPANILLNYKINFSTSFFIAVASAFMFTAYLSFRKGMVHYAKYGSPRYSGFGHR